MPKIKLTKSELKQQRDALKQFQHFLPTLQLKKQQLQLEIRNCEAKMEEIIRQEKAFEDGLDSWAALFSSPEIHAKAAEILSISEVVTSRQNIAGLDVPVLDRVEFDEAAYDLFGTPPSLDDALEAVRNSIRMRIEKMIVMKQVELIAHELRITSQRVNLFEKVKIPEAKENIRMIQIYLGDEDTASVGRSKMAKRKMTEAA